MKSSKKTNWSLKDWVKFVLDKPIKVRRKNIVRVISIVRRLYLYSVWKKESVRKEIYGFVCLDPMSQSSGEKNQYLFGAPIKGTVPERIAHPGYARAKLTVYHGGMEPGAWKLRKG